MTEKRKISGRKVLQFLVTIIVTTGCIVAVAFASKSGSARYIKGIDVEIKNERKCHFIDKGQVMDLLVNDRHVDINHIPAGKLDLHGMEQIVAANPWVGNAEIFVDNTHNLHINLTQRVPVARVFEEDGNSYYLDTALASMPLSDRYIYYTTVVTNVPVLKDDSLSKSWKAQIVHLVRCIEKDTFWNAQVSQIIMTPEHTFELVPVLGHQRILIGDTALLQEKLNNLFAFYKGVLNKIGWDKYDVIDVRYKGQVVATPALPWNAPVDKAMSSMNWVKSIVGNDTGKSFTPVATTPAAAAPTVPPVTVAKAQEVKVTKAATQAEAAVKVPVKPAAVVVKTPAKPAVTPVKEVTKPATVAVKTPVKPVVVPVKAPEKKIMPAAKTPTRATPPVVKAVKTTEKPIAKKEVPEKAVKALPASAYPKVGEVKTEKVAAKPAIGPPKPDDLADKPEVTGQPKAIMPAAKKEVKATDKKIPVKPVKKEASAKKAEAKKPAKKEEVKKQTVKDKSKDSNKNH